MSVSSGVMADLQALGLTDSGEGQAALTLAEQLDSPAEDETSTGRAALVRELRMVMAGLRARPAKTAADPLDELEAKRAKRRA